MGGAGPRRGDLQRVLVILVGVMVLALSASCSDGQGAPPPSRAAPTPTCGLPKAQMDPDIERLPPELILGGDVLRSHPGPGLDTTLIVHEGTVEGLQDAYREVAPRAGLEVVQEDFEGFEAELYVRSGDELGMIQLRETGCEGTILVYLRLPPAS